MGSMGEELQTLRTRAEEATRMQSELKEVKADTSRLQGLYQEEQASSPSRRGIAFPLRFVCLIIEAWRKIRRVDLLVSLLVFFTLKNGSNMFHKCQRVRLAGVLVVGPQTLRKKYWNMMEDMKGKIRVFARCRPFAQ